MAEVTPGTTPTQELGHGRDTTQFWAVAAEETPELRWPRNLFTYDQMRRQDSQVASVLRAVTLPVLRTNWQIDPAGASPEVVALISEDFGLDIKGEEPRPYTRARDRFSWRQHLAEALLMLTYGHMFFEQVCRVDEQGRVRLRKLAARMPRSIEEIKVAPDGGLVAIVQEAIEPGKMPVEIPVSRLVAYVHEREGGNWFGKSLLRPAYKHWLLKDRILRTQSQSIERNGMGVPTFEAAPNATQADIDAGSALAQSYRSGQNAGLGYANGAKLRLVGVEGSLPDTEGPVRYHDEQIARAVLAHYLNLSTRGGSYALASTQEETFTQSLQTIAQQVADVATQHIVEDLVDWNFGPDEPSPRLVFEEIGSRQAATAQAIKFLTDAGILLPDKSLEEAVRQSMGLPPKDPRTGPTPTPDDGSTA